jgi:hypothetical protein
MSNHFYLASLIVLAGCAPAEKPAVAAPRALPVAACTADSRVLFQSTERPNPLMPARDGAVTSTTLYEGGTWEVRGPSGVRSGCAPAGVVSIVREDLARATWTVTSVGAACDAIGATVTDYVASGKPVFTAELCSLRELDADSAKVLARAVHRLEELSRPAPATCTGGASLIHISHRVDGAVSSQRTWELDVSTDGSFTFAGKNPEDHRAKCLNVDELARIQRLLAKMTWNVGRPSAKCVAFSPEHDVYSVGGAQVADLRLCGDALEAEDTARLAAIRNIVDHATARS